jgi:hypothetical protein
MVFTFKNNIMYIQGLPWLPEGQAGIIVWGPIIVYGIFG